MDILSMQTELEKLITQYSLDTENPDHNFSLGIWYDSNGHTAPALSYFLRCAERTDDLDLAYEALIKASYCYEKQGTRDGSAKSLLEQALVLLPKRPEAYYLLSRFAERRQFWQDCYIHANNGLNWADFDCKPLRTNVEYPGKYGLLFEKSISGWWWGKTEESRNILQNILLEYKLNDYDYNLIVDNLKKMGVEPPEKSNVEVEVKESQFNYPNDFDWSSLTYEDIITIEREIVHEKVYRFWEDVKENDVVLDVGASVGAYVISILDQKPKKVYCVEPSKKLLKTLSKNCSEKVFDYSENPLVYINHGIVDNENDKINIFGGEEEFTGITFRKLIDSYEINHINYMKIDCEGGEYSIFKEENMQFLKNNVDFIAMEVHLNYEGCREKFKRFRDNYLTQFDDYKVMSCTRQNISWGTSLDIKNSIFDNNFIDNYTCEFMIYISNKSRNFSLQETEIVNEKVISERTRIHKIDKSKIFDWGNLDSIYVNTYANDNFINRIYENHYSVKENDIVVDIGANCGSFTYSILENKPKHVYCIESNDCWINPLYKNLTGYPTTIIHKKLSDVNDKNSITFESFVNENKIEKIDFLKFSCEGAEHFIFNAKNKDFITKNVKYAAGQWNFAPNNNSGINFIIFRNLYLKKGNFRVYDKLSQEITDKIYNDQFILDFEEYSWQLYHSGVYNGQFLVYMWNI